MNRGKLKVPSKLKQYCFKRRFHDLLVRHLVYTKSGGHVGLGAVILCANAILLAFGITVASTSGTAFAQEGPAINAESAILIEAGSGKVIYSMNAQKPLPPASMSKMMTEYLVLEAIEEGRLSWNQEVVISESAAAMEGSQVWLYPGEKRTVSELFTAMAVYSANDATRALAEFLGSSESGFTQMMNEKAQELGMHNTYFATSSGFPLKDIPEAYRPQAEGENQMSAEDAAILGRELVQSHPEIFDFTTIPRAIFREGEGQGEIRMDNWNWLVDSLVYAYEGADGLKTGNTEDAGFCITATAERGGTRFIAVIMGADTMETRFVEVRKLLDFGFNNFVVREVVQGKEPVPGHETAPVTRGRRQEVPVVTQAGLSTLMKKGEEDMYNVEVVFDKMALQAPVAAQEVVGVARLIYIGETNEAYLSNIPPESRDQVALVAQEEVKKANWFTLFTRSVWDAITGFFGGK